MRYKVIISILCCFTLLLTGCTIESVPDSSTDNDKYPKAYAYVEEDNADHEVARLDWDHILKIIPSNYYEDYPGLPAAPLIATLYKNGEAEVLDVDDPRLVKLMNFYHNMVYNEVYSYTQGSFSPNEYEEMEREDFRLELAYEPRGDSFETTFDKMLIVNGNFIGVRSDVPFGEYPYSSFGRYPLYVESVDWLELFGF